jgi:hypothetical protein
MNKKESDPYKVCLTWQGGGRKTISLATNTTMHDFGVMAKELVGSEVDLAVGYPPETLILSNDITSRSVIPRMTRVHCTEQEHTDNDKKRVLETTSTENDNDNDSRKKQRAAKENDNIVDLTEDDTVDDDEAYARRLNQEEIEAAARRNAPGAGNASSLSAAQPSFRRPPLQNRDERDPTTVNTGEPWIYESGPASESSGSVLGKWLVYPSLDNTAELWRATSSAVASGVLGSPQAKVSTKSKTESNRQGKDVKHGICVYTTKASMDEVGIRLIHITKQRFLCYKTDEATGQGRYSENSKNISVRQLYWNKARPIFTKPTTMTVAKSKSLALKAAKEKPDLSLRFDDPTLTLTGMNHFVSRDKQRFEIGVTSVVLVREPENSFDKNAIRVEDASRKKIGYILKAEAAVLAPWLDDALIRIDSCVVNHRVGDSTMYLLLKGWSCAAAKDMLATL